jgi:hypothetical protein
MTVYADETRSQIEADTTRSVTLHLTAEGRP